MVKASKKKKKQQFVRNEALMRAYQNGNDGKTVNPARPCDLLAMRGLTSFVTKITRNRNAAASPPSHEQRPNHPFIQVYRALTPRSASGTIRTVSASLTVVGKSTDDAVIFLDIYAYQSKTVETGHSSVLQLIPPMWYCRQGTSTSRCYTRSPTFKQECNQKERERDEMMA